MDPISFSYSAPGRCGIVGNPSDIYGGKVLSCSVPLRNRCIVESEGLKRSLDGQLLWDAAVRRVGPLSDSNLKVRWESNLPRSSGLSGSTALLAATLASLLSVHGKPLNLATNIGKTAFAELLRDTERNDAGIVCGFQDAYMIVFGGLNFLDFAGKHPLMPGPSAQLTPVDADLPFLLITTGVERLSGSVHGPIVERWLRGEEIVRRHMKRIAALAEVGAECLQQRNYEALASCMKENHELVAELGGSGKPIDDLISAAVSSGALAAKLAGAGLGGTVIALTENPEELQALLSRRGYSQFIRPSKQPGLCLDHD